MRSKSGAVAAFLGLVAWNESSGAESLTAALKETQPMIDWRLRYEEVDQAGVPESADALTSRLRAGFRTGAWGTTSLLGELVWTSDVLDDFNSTTNGQTQFPVVADPGGFAAVNRFAITNKSLKDTTLTFGRQRIIFDDSRFVGNVGWRQNEQTYDGLRVQTAVEGLDIDLAYISQVNRIFGPDSPAGKWDGNIALVNVSSSHDWGKLTVFYYGLDIDQAAASSTGTLGLRLSGSKPVGTLTALYTLSGARQRDAGANPADFSERYYFVEAGFQLKQLILAVGYEELSSDGANRLTTPLATLHAFQGWADQFLGTPVNGIEDRFARLSYEISNRGPFQSVAFVGAFHDFEANLGQERYGNEIDLSIVARLPRMAFTLKYADYRADELLTDTKKFWFSLDYAF